MTLSKVRGVGAGLLVAALATLGGFGLLRTAAVAAAPVPEAKARTEKDPLERVTVEDAAALLKVEAVQKEVGLSAEQKKKLGDLRADAKANLKNAFQMKLQGIAQGAVPPGGNIDLGFGDGPDPELDQALLGELKSEQVRRLKQITLQAMGPAALLDRRVIRALGLTAEQEDKIDAHLRELPRPNPIIQVIQVVGGQVVNGPEGNGPAGKIDAVWDAALHVLTPNQRTKWDALVGKRLPTEELQKAQSGPDLGEFLDLFPNVNPANPLPPGQ